MKPKILLTILILLSLTLQTKAWVEPTGTENIVAPLNTSSTAQTKAGDLGTNGNLCIKGDCKSAWPTSSSDTLQSVTERGAVTNKEIQAPVFRDHDNAGYYLDPNNSSNLNAVNGDYFHSARNDSWFPYPGNNYNYLRGNTLMNGVLYDENNSGYYLDPNSWSNLELINVSNHLCMRGDCRPNWTIPRRSCFWIRLETHWMAACPDGYHVDGMGLTNNFNGCWEAGCVGWGNSWVTAGGFLCCND